MRQTLRQKVPSTSVVESCPRHNQKCVDYSTVGDQCEMLLDDAKVPVAAPHPLVQPVRSTPAANYDDLYSAPPDPKHMHK